MATKTKVRTYSIENARLFENDRGMIGFNLDLHFNGYEIGSVSHDGNGMTYSYTFNGQAVRRAHEDVITDEKIDALLEAKGL
jgi:hypothetical protein